MNRIATESWRISEIIKETVLNFMTSTLANPFCPGAALLRPIYCEYPVFNVRIVNKLQDRTTPCVL